jgi:hypothetical protein
VMETNGYTEFMTNAPTLKSRVNPERDAMREFVTQWYTEKQTHSVTAKYLFELASIESEYGEEKGAVEMC